MLRPVSPLHVYLLRSLQVTRLRSWMARLGGDGKINCRTSDIPSGETVIPDQSFKSDTTCNSASLLICSTKLQCNASYSVMVSSVYSGGTVNTRTGDFKNDIVTFPLACAEALPSWLTLASPALTFTLLVRGAYLHMRIHMHIMDEPVVRAAKMEPEVVQALREEPGVDSALPLDVPADGVVFLVQFQAGNLDYMNVRLGAQKLGLRRALPVPLSQHGKSSAHFARKMKRDKGHIKDIYSSTAYRQTIPTFVFDGTVGGLSMRHIGLRQLAMFIEVPVAICRRIAEGIAHILPKLHSKVTAGHICLKIKHATLRSQRDETRQSWSDDLSRLRIIALSLSLPNNEKELRLFLIYFETLNLNMLLEKIHQESWSDDLSRLRIIALSLSLPNNYMRFIYYRHDMLRDHQFGLVRSSTGIFKLLSFFLRATADLWYLPWCLDSMWLYH
ncbi:hypothetical protein G5I_13566 [Acromyrmex echinatior]|uniref:Uncharacterized protein n=1 Tax=Acromyrmex echinatior TaxID=103372 RepID=F4X5D4_ACREC|nr:hypothetical protein G5I_13566 [Acromyrmex echinatior]